MAKTPEATSAVGSAAWVEGIIKGLDPKSSPPKDERERRAAVRRFIQIDQTLREGKVEPAARSRATAFRRDFYAWLLKERKPGGWSLAELEGAPFLNDKERHEWSLIPRPAPRARFFLDVMSKRAAALFKLVDEARKVDASTKHGQTKAGKA